MSREKIIEISVQEDLLQVKQFLEHTKKDVFHIVSEAGRLQLIHGINAFFDEISQECGIAKEQLELMHYRCILTSKEYQIKTMFTQPAIKKNVSIDVFNPTHISCKEDIVKMLHILSDNVSEDFLHVHEALITLLHKCKLDRTMIRAIFSEIDAYEKSLLEKINKVLLNAVEGRIEHIQSDDFIEAMNQLKDYSWDIDEIPERWNKDIANIWPIISEGVIMRYIGEHSKADSMLQEFPDVLIETCTRCIFDTLDVKRRDDFLWDNFDMHPLYSTTVYESEIVEIWLQVCILQKLNQFLVDHKTFRIIPNKDISDNFFSIHDLYQAIGHGKKNTTEIESGSVMESWVNSEKQFYHSFFTELLAYKIKEDGSNRQEKMRSEIKEIEDAEREKGGLPF